LVWLVAIVLCIPACLVGGPALLRMRSGSWLLGFTVGLPVGAAAVPTAFFAAYLLPIGGPIILVVLAAFWGLSRTVWGLALVEIGICVVVGFLWIVAGADAIARGSASDMWFSAALFATTLGAMTLLLSGVARVAWRSSRA